MSECVCVCVCVCVRESVCARVCVSVSVWLAACPLGHKIIIIIVMIEKDIHSYLSV